MIIDHMVELGVTFNLTVRLTQNRGSSSDLLTGKMLLGCLSSEKCLMINYGPTTYICISWIISRFGLAPICTDLDYVLFELWVMICRKIIQFLITVVMGWTNGSILRHDLGIEANIS